MVERIPEEETSPDATGPQAAANVAAVTQQGSGSSVVEPSTGGQSKYKLIKTTINMLHPEWEKGGCGVGRVTWQSVV